MIRGRITLIVELAVSESPTGATSAVTVVTPHLETQFLM
jgi:hypothetical protein